MRKNSITRGLLVAIVILAVVVPTVLRAQPGRGGRRPHEDQFLSLAKALPGLGGFSFDSLGNLHVFLTDTTQAGRARVLLAPTLASRRRGGRDRQAGRPEIVVHIGQFDFPTLRSWHDSLTMRVLGLEGAVYTDIAEDRNRIVIGIDRQKASVGRSNVQRTLARLGVPPGMVELVETVGFVIDAYKSTCNPCAPGNTSTGTVSEATYTPSATTLSSRIRPLEGGIETDYFRQADGFYYGCSLGFLAYRSQQRVLITASHCSADFGAPDGTGYYQPTVEAGNY